MKIGPIGNERKSMSRVDTAQPATRAVSGESRFCPECGSPLPDPEGVERETARSYWSSARP